MSVGDELDRLNRRTVSEEDREEALEAFPEPHTGSHQATGDSRRHSDADAIRRFHGIAPWDPTPYEEADHSAVLPDCYTHEWNAPPDRVSGGTDFLARGKPGSGKSTLGCHFATRQLEINDEIVYWRGSESRSEWLPLAPWTTLFLPKFADVQPRLVPRDKSKPPVQLRESDLDRIVRDIVYYRNPLELLDHQQPGQFHVVYPDPDMRGCQELFESSETKNYDAPPRGTLFGPSDPAAHWWFAFVLARTEFVETAPFTTLILDEIGEIAPQSASKDQFASYQKVELLRDLWIDARKFGLTFAMFCHSEVDVHQFIRHKIRWRIQMPTTSNPTTAGSVVGFEEVPMNHDMTARFPLGKGLLYTETNFDRFRWPNYLDPTNYKLKISLRGRSS